MPTRRLLVGIFGLYTSRSESSRLLLTALQFRGKMKHIDLIIIESPSTIDQIAPPSGATDILCLLYDLGDLLGMIGNDCEELTKQYSWHTNTMLSARKS